ncbi:hypothetical protein [Quadrisphaera setariae]|uniref:Uncharacterized protein n=1 Tax=Quadrisphaera setariae TaxID=2593304 RepID=A0A5C8ZFY8_9ACTN|nr:hypothetical protein [Quadrisphaera setariae]TXR56179.1 hypothetical protein FMM08_12215 [Quadrisphaera setariae]
MTTTTTTTPSAHLADTAATSTPLAPPVRVGVRELAGSVVVLTPGRSLLVTGADDAAWRASAQDCSVAAIGTPAQVAAADAAEPVDAHLVCSLTAVAPGRTRGHLVSAGGQHHPFEVIVLAPQPDTQPAAVAARQPLERSRPSRTARCRRVLRPLGRPGAPVIANG